MNAPLLIEEEAAVVVAVPGDAASRRRARAIASIVARDSPRSIGFGTPFGNVPSGS